jgi:hypothetical protein
MPSDCWRLDAPLAAENRREWTNLDMRYSAFLVSLLLDLAVLHD